MTEYIHGAARALAAVDSEAEAAELPSPTEVNPDPRPYLRRPHVASRRFRARRCALA